MASVIYKHPKRTKKAHKGRALIYSKQYNYSRRKTALYQQRTFYTFGPEYGLISSLQALSATVDKFNELYQDTLTNKHAFLILCIKHYVTLHKVDKFHTEDIRTFYNVTPIVGYFAKGSRSFKTLFNDLTLMHFCNPHRRQLMPTTRIKVFTSMYANILKDLFNATYQELT